MRIKTKKLLREYVFRQLGAPSINVEITEDQMNDCIDKAIERYSEHAYDGCTTGSMLIDIEPGVFSYILPDNVIAVTGLQASSVYNSFINIPAGYALAMHPLTMNTLDNISNVDIQSTVASMSAMSNIRSLFDVRVNFTFNSNTKELTFHEKTTSLTFLLELGIDYEPNEIDNIYNNVWVKNRVVGEAFVMWSTVTGKYSSSLVNGSSINYDDMRSKGEDIIDKSEEELFEIGEPLGIYVF